MRQQDLQRVESRSGRGVLSQDDHGRSALRVAMRGIRSAGFVAWLLVGSMGFSDSCSGDNSNAGTGGAGGTGTGTGGSSGSGGSGGGDGDGSVACSARTDVDLYSANMTKKGQNGLMSFLLIQSDPAPPVFGVNVWKLKVTGMDGMPVSKGLTVDVFMPDHGHPSPLTPNITYDAATGVYGLDPIYLSMSGKWRITFNITDPNDSSVVIDKVEFYFCVA